jgi:hypothetical protein
VVKYGMTLKNPKTSQILAISSLDRAAKRDIIGASKRTINNKVDVKES